MSCISNSAYTTAENLRTGAALTNAVLKSSQLVYEAYRSGQDLIDNYRKQNDLARRAQDIAEAIQGQQAVFWAAEDQFRDEFTQPEPIEDVEVMGRRYSGRLVSSILGKFADKIHEIKCSMNRYCTSANMKALQDIYLMRSFAVSTARTLGRNIAHAEYQARTDLNWEKRKQAAALGRKLAGDGASLIAAAGRGLASMAAGHEQSLNSALQAAGLAWTRPDLSPDRPGARDSAGMVETEDDTYTSGSTVYGPSTSSTYQSNNGAQMYGADAAYQSNGGQPMYGVEQPPADLLGAGDQLNTSSGMYTDDQDLYRDGSNQNFNGPVDKVRRGAIDFPVIGGPGVVHVDMDKFEVGYADHLDANDVKAVTPQNPSNWPS
jgi:hypothetical protein